MKSIFKMFLGVVVLIPVSAMAERQFCCLPSFGSTNISSFWCVTSSQGAATLNSYYSTDTFKIGSIQMGNLNQNEANNCTAAEEALCDAGLEAPEPSPVCEEVPAGSPVPSECSEAPSEPTPTPTPTPIPTPPFPFPIPTGVDCNAIPVNMPIPSECEAVPVPGSEPGEVSP